MPLAGMPVTMPHGSCLHPPCQMKGISCLHLADREAQAAPVKPSDLLSTVNLCEVGPDSGNLMKLSNCARFPLVWVSQRAAWIFLLYLRRYSALELKIKPQSKIRPGLLSPAFKAKMYYAQSTLQTKGCLNAII